MKIATQIDIDLFVRNAMIDKSIYPYMSLCKWSEEWKEYKNDWEGLIFTNSALSCLLRIKFDRGRGEPEMSIALFSTNAFAAGRAVLIVKELINRYKPRAINSTVHATNVKSLKLHSRIFGDPWGIEPSVAWDSGIGEFVAAHYFRKLL